MKTNIPHQLRNSGTVICGGNRKCTCPGKEHEIVLILYDEAAYLKDDTDGVRILFTGSQD